MAEKDNLRGDTSETHTNDAKGKQKATDADTSLSNRIQQSAEMAFHSLARGPPSSSTTYNSSEPKSSQVSGFSEHERLQPTLAEVPSHRIHQSAHLDTARFRGGPSSSNDAIFASYQSGPEMLPLSNPQLPRHYDQTDGTFAQQEAVDGAAVLGLLSEGPSDSGLLGIYLPSGEELLITKDEQERLAQALFLGTEGAKLETLLEPAEDDKEANIWADEHWREVFTSYTADVWGDLGPLSLAAKQEVENPAKGTQGTPALTQLTSALRQLRAKL